MQRIIDINTVGIDYLGVTSFDSKAYDIHKLVAEKIRKLNPKETDPSHFLQYTGLRLDTIQGSFYAGMAEQSKRDHYYMSISGELANDTDLWSVVLPGIGDGWLRCSRLDLQATIDFPKGWKQWALFNRQQAANRASGWAQSTSRAGNVLRTVYIGDRKNGHFVRCYEKEVNGVVYLRLEFELKRGTARNYLRAIQRGDATPAALFKRLLQTQPDRELENAFAWVVEHATAAARPTGVKEDSKTKEWLLTSVLPAFRREINRDDTDNEVLDAFTQAIEQANRWTLDTLFDTE